jgi:hypothetical protein
MKSYPFEAKLVLDDVGDDLAACHKWEDASGTVLIQKFQRALWVGGIALGADAVGNRPCYGRSADDNLHAWLRRLDHAGDVLQIDFGGGFI